VAAWSVVEMDWRGGQADVWHWFEPWDTIMPGPPQAFEA
jgi:hypothetical protein